MTYFYFGTSASAKIPSCKFPLVDIIRSGQCRADHVYIISTIDGPWLLVVDLTV